MNTLSRLAGLLLTAMLAVSTQADSPASPPAETQPPQIAIIFDDIGNSYRRGRQAISLPAAFTYAVLPFTRHSKALANRAHHLGKEVMVHLPMQNEADRPLGPAGVHESLGREEFRQIVSDALKGVPHAAGLNNHMGSLLTRRSQQMLWLMEVLKEGDYYFIDSRTTPLTVASVVALQNDILSASRDVFLDNERAEVAIDRQFRELLAMAEARGTAIDIGHPYPETIAYLKHAVTKLPASGIEIVPVSVILERRIRDATTLSVARGTKTSTPTSEKNQVN